MVNEVILTILFILAGVSVLISLCAGAAKIGGIFTGVSDPKHAKITHIFLALSIEEFHFNYQILI